MTGAKAYAIEVQGRSAGIVVAERGGFTFFAADKAFRILDRRFFRQIHQAETAARQLTVHRDATSLQIRQTSPLHT